MAAKLTNPEPIPEESQRELEAIRSGQELRALTDEEDGTGSDKLPSGVFGFTYSPCADNFPFFKDRDLRSYEAHKRADGTLVLLGFLTLEERKTLETAAAPSRLRLFPEPKDEAHQLVQIPLSRIRSHDENSQRSGTGLIIEVAPKS